MLTVAPPEVQLVGPTAAHDHVRLLREIAAGPRSCVYVGELPGAGGATGRDLVAVKVFSERSPRDAQTLFRLRELGLQLASLHHPVLSPPLAVVEVDGRLGMVSEYVDGIDLFDLCEVLWETQARLHARVICGILAEVAGALDAALHRIPDGSEAPLDRSHRDLRPANIMLDRAGGVHLLDHAVGLTSLVGREARSESLKRGLTRYLSPGRRAGKRGGPPSDIYALGIIGVELARGGWLKRLRARNPDHDRHLAEVVARITDLGFRTEGDELAMRNLLLRMVAHDPDARPDAAEVIETCRTLREAATGADLPGFAIAHVAPWLEPVPSTPDQALDLGPVRVLHTPEEAPTAEFSEDEVADSEDDWVETPNGWEQATDQGQPPLPDFLPQALSPAPLPPVEDDGAFLEDERTVWDHAPVTDESTAPPAPVATPLAPPRSRRGLAPVLLLLAVGATGIALLAALGLAWLLWS